ncbi:sensor histidine kinase [Jeotgalibacillus proteolyticus]|uniref:sensor histidine kinase n=1 Tax=Jeotgalibacillus proteolyticus TaxID=2082395 RepID=UPI003CEB9E26
MLYLMIGAIIGFIYLLTRLYLLKKEIKNTARQLHQVNQNQTNKKLDVSFFDRDFEELAMKINGQIDLTKQAEATKRSTEYELKQAISHISHDIRTPMTSIIGYIQLLESDEISSELKKEYLATIKNSAARLKVLLEDFFELSIIEQDDFPLKMETIRLNDLVMDTLFSFYGEFTNNRIEPNIHITEDEIYMKTDSSAFIRIIENLIVNAIRYSTGDIIIDLEKMNSVVQLKISNTADNISEEDVKQMFDRFFKADQTRTGKGTGLGLPIAKSLMGKINGTIRAELRGNYLTITCEWKI